MSEITSLLFSIIIPVYNPGDLLFDCLNSILEQIDETCEIILIDDGSTDGSADICDIYALNNNKILSVHQENSGAATARNNGMRRARGKYILFVDADDMLIDNAIEIINNTVNESEAEIVFFDTLKLFSDGHTASVGDCVEKEYLKGVEQSQAFAYLSTRPKYPSSPCGKAFYRKFLLDNNLFFEDGLLSEDLDWTLKVICAANDMSANSTPVYLYRQDLSKSASKSKNPKRVWDTLKIVERWVNICITEDLDSDNPKQKMILSFMAYEYPLLIAWYNNIERHLRKEYRERLKKNAWIFRYRNTLKNKLVFFSYHAFGIPFTSMLLNVYLKLR